MSFIKKTIITGRLKRTGLTHAMALNGHWNIESAIRRAQKAYSGHVTITHDVMDTSGMGRSGHDGRWEVNLDNDNNEITKTSNWSEFGVENRGGIK